MVLQGARTMNKTKLYAAITAVVLTAGVALLVIGPHIVPPVIPFPTADSLMVKLSNDATTTLNDPSMRFRYPLLPVNSIGTLVRPDSRGGFVDANLRVFPCM